MNNEIWAGKSINNRKDIIALVTAKLFSVAISAVALKASTNYLDPAAYGFVSIMLSIQMFCGLFLVYPIGQFINVKTHEWSNDGTLMHRLTGYKYFIILISVAGGAFGLLSTKNAENYSPYQVFATLSFYILSYTWYSTFVPMLNMLGKRIYSAGIGTISLITELVLAVGFSLNEGNAITWLLGQAIGFCVGGVWAKQCLEKQKDINRVPSLRLSFVEKKHLLRYCLPLAIGALLLWIQQTGYRFIIEKYWGLESLAYLAVGLQIANQMGGAAEGLIIQFLYPKFFKQCASYEQKNSIENTLSDLLNATIPVAIMMTGLGIGISKAVLIILVSHEFRIDPIIVCMGMVIEFCRVITNVISNGAHAQTDARTLRIPYFIGALSTIGLVGAAGLLSMTIEHALYALVATAVISLISMWFSIGKIVKIKIDNNNVYKSAFCSTLVAISGIIFFKVESLSDALLCVGTLLMVSIILTYVIQESNHSYRRLLNVDLGVNK